MNKAVRAIIIRDGKLLVMKRNKFGKQYYTLIGGHVEPGESIEQALLREVSEETGLNVSRFKLVFIEEPGDPYGKQHVFLCEDPGGHLQMQPDADETKSNLQGQNTYTPMWLEIKELEDKEFLSPLLKQAILDGVKSGFPSEVTQLD